MSASPTKDLPITASPNQRFTNQHPIVYSAIDNHSFEQHAGGQHIGERLTSAHRAIGHPATDVCALSRCATDHPATAQLVARLPTEPQLVLVTDLDGTLLEGSPAAKGSFYAWLEQRRDRVLHVFSTGRDLASVGRLLLQEAIQRPPAPHLVISDVGATVACGTSLALLPGLVDPIERRWQGCAERLAPLLRNQPGLSPQPVSAHRRLAYDVDLGKLDPGLPARLSAQGVDCLISADRYLDVLPAGVNKGSTLLALLEWLELDPSTVITDGDSLNDLAMFQTGLKGVMVGNAEPALRQELPRLQRTYAARAPGCEGIAEGLRHFGFAHLFD